ncbi:hypothetical protein HDU77_000246, partial [Chytriomyces hyalinus]
RICNHQECRKCSAELSRQHGIECAGINQVLQMAFDNSLGLPPDLTASGATIIDEAVSKLEYKTGINPKIEATYNAINKVRLECGGYSEIVDASSATLQQEIDAVFNEYEGPRSIRVQATTIMSAHLTLRTSNHLTEVDPHQKHQLEALIAIAAAGLAAGDEVADAAAGAADLAAGEQDIYFVKFYILPFQNFSRLSHTLKTLGKLAVVVSAATPDGFKQFEKDTWQYAKKLLTCKRLIADSVCGSAFQTKSACGSETPFGLRLISIACKGCEHRPRLRDACRNSGIEALIELSVESAKLEAHLRANFNRKQRNKAAPSFIQPVPKKRTIAEVDSSSEDEVIEDIDSEKKEKMSGSTMNLAEITKMVQDHSKRVDEFMKTIHTQMAMMREQIYRPKNLNRTQNFNHSFKAAPSYKEIAAMSIQSDFNVPAHEGPPPVRAESIKSCFVSLRFLKKEAKLNGPMKATRAIFRETFELPYIEDISPLGHGFSIAEIFFDGRHKADIRQKLDAKEILLADFNPLDTPPHLIDANEETMREQMCARRAGVYRRARFALVKQAALAGCDMAMPARIRELAAPQKGTQSASNMEQ